MFKAWGAPSAGIGIGTVIVCVGVGAATPPALAQDPSLGLNLLNRVETFIPEPEPASAPRETVVVQEQREITQTVVVQETVPRPLAEVEAEAEARNIAQPKTIFPMTDQEKLDYFEAKGILVTTTKPRSKTVKKTITVDKKVELPPTVKAVLNGVVGFSYQSNATTSPTDIVPDSIADNSAGLLVTIPVGSADDAIALSFGPNAVRYSKLDDASFDALSGSAVYTHQRPKKYRSAYRTPGTVTRDSFSIAVQGLSLYQPGFGPTTFRALTPSVSWGRSNIPISSKICGGPGAESYCHFAGVGISLSGSSTSNTSQDNVNATLSATVGWRTPVKGLTFSAGGSAVGRSYTNFTGGREDLVFVPIVNISWSPHPQVAMTASTKYTDQSSTVPLAQWNGFNLFPKATLRIEF